MSFVGSGLEFGMILNSEIKSLLCQFHLLAEFAVRGHTRKCCSRFLESFFEIIIEFISVAMALGYLIFFIEPT